MERWGEGEWGNLRVGEGEKVRVRVGESERGREGESEKHSTLNLLRAVRSPDTSGQPSTISLSKKYSFHSTHDIINACKSGKLPNQIMMNFHPQRWTDDPVKWTQELVWQNVKNVVKWGLVSVRD